MHVSFDSVSARHPAARAGSPSALRGLQLDVQPGEQVAVIGPSGAGKTTLLHVAAAALPPAQGHVRLGSADPWALGARSLRRLRGRLFLAPQVPPLPPRQRVVTSVLAGRLPAMSLARSLRSLFYPQDIPGAHAALARFEIESKIFDRVDRLSGGERQRVGLARALLSPASLWLIDEPLSSLDPTRARHAIDTLLDVATQRKVTLVATLHQVDVALDRFARVIGMRAGEKAFDQPASQVTPQMLADLYGDEFASLADAAPESEPPVDDTTGKVVVMHCR